MIMGFIDTMRAQGHAVESVCRVLREQGCQVAARTYRAWRSRRTRWTDMRASTLTTWVRKHTHRISGDQHRR
jgi:putative transposase